MCREPTYVEWKEMEEMAAEIETCSGYLQKYRVRQMIGTSERAKLVKIQRHKSMIIEELKIFASQFARVPKSVMRIYFPVD
uniref:AsIV-cont00046-ORF1 n=1 Tax=Apophua simplicipes ichnovirus TaxID=1329648 RepID=S5DSZ9_9VIRU|nr:AsIV-cont00046-ORF1 [Apophua simplicipes ichnovirus]